ncbi:hypothetical protein U9M48_007396 [Paspalum notatum var. saurae]|uniref:Uncharacterized protein n=1 Tax=Paspalum notatum var. saurae TaxID=547442 RepID=A0AAQ3Q1F7_PASNO
MQGAGQRWQKQEGRDREEYYKFLSLVGVSPVVLSVHGSECCLFYKFANGACGAEADDGTVSCSPPSVPAGRSSSWGSSGLSSARTNCTNSGQWPGEKKSAPIRWYVNWHGRVRPADSQTPVEPAASRAAVRGTLSAARRAPFSSQAAFSRASTSSAGASSCASTPDAITVHPCRANTSATGPYPPWRPAVASAGRDPRTSGTLADSATGVPPNARDAAARTRSACARSSPAYQDRKNSP